MSQNSSCVSVSCCGADRKYSAQSDFTDCAFSCPDYFLQACSCWVKCFMRKKVLCTFYRRFFSLGWISRVKGHFAVTRSQRKEWDCVYVCSLIIFCEWSALEDGPRDINTFEWRKNFFNCFCKLFEYQPLKTFEPAPGRHFDWVGRYAGCTSLRLAASTLNTVFKLFL